MYRYSDFFPHPGHSLYNDNEYNIYESLAINFELSGIKNESIIQNTIPFLINGVSMRQQLRGGQILYYRLKEYMLINSLIQYKQIENYFINSR